MKAGAIEHFKNRQGNCAQSVARAWAEKSGHPDADELHRRFESCGGGKAPEGLCGALHAACELAGESHHEAVKAQFADKAEGKLTCRDIRRGRIMPCADCVGTAATALETVQAGK